MNVTQLTDALYASIRAYKITRDSSFLLAIHDITDEIKRLGFRPIYVPKREVVCVARTSALDVTALPPLTIEEQLYVDPA